MHFQISQVYQFAQHDGKFLTTHQSVLHTLLVGLILFVVNVFHYPLLRSMFVFTILRKHG